jgi:tetratricopeptide (TPR) repeat protein
MQINFLENTKPYVFMIVMVVVTSCSSTEDKNVQGPTKTKEKVERVVTYTPKTLLKEIQDIEKALDNPNMPQRTELTAQLVDFYLSYADLFSKDPLMADMIFKAGNQSVNLENFDDALAHYNRIDLDHVKYQKRPESIYLQGFIYDTYKNEFGKAKEKYERIIELYPNHILAEQAKQSIAHLGLSDEEIIRSFEKK